MKYLLLIHQGNAPTPRDPEDWGTLSEDEKQAVAADYQAINQTPGVTPGLWMAPPETATTVRVQDGRTLTTDGPFVAVKEALGGYFVLEADDLDAAIELAARIPAARLGGAVEVRADQGVVAILEQTFRDEWGRVVAALIGFLGDFDVAEEAAQEAFAIAAERWPRDGTPDNPRAWLVATARNRAIDRLRRDRTLADEDAPARRPRGDGGRGGRRRGDPRRAARADLHLLPPGARARRAGGADAADARRR